MTKRIEVTSQGEHAFLVTVRDSQHTTHHQILVPENLLVELGLDTSEENELVRLSFEFLLQRETSTSILTEFRLDVIGHYFPDYVKTMRLRLASNDH
jgi:hypothetical protein